MGTYEEDLAAARPDFEAKYGRVWDTAQLQEEFTVLSFLAPYVRVQRKSDGQRGLLEFRHYPRFYFNWVEEK